MCSHAGLGYWRVDSEADFCVDRDLAAYSSSSVEEFREVRVGDVGVPHGAREYAERGSGEVDRCGVGRCGEGGTLGPRAEKLSPDQHVLRDERSVVLGQAAVCAAAAGTVTAGDDAGGASRCV